MKKARYIRGKEGKGTYIRGKEREVISGERKGRCIREREGDVYQG